MDRRQVFLGGALAFLGGLLPWRAFAQARPPADTGPADPLNDEHLLGLLARSGAPALAAEAQGGGTGSVQWLVGVRRAGTEDYAQPGDLWHIGSITKSMTATLIARLVDQGVIAWSDTVGGILGGEAASGPYAEATFLHLLSHRSGLPANLPIARLPAYATPSGDVVADRARYVAEGLALPPVGPMRETFLYSNQGYVTAGAMIERRTGQSWEQLMREHLFAPLGLTSAGFGAPTGDQPWGHRAGLAGLSPVDPSRPFADNPEPLGPAGRVHMNLHDLTAYLGAHRDRSAYLKPETWDVLHTPPFGGEYALGWVVRPEGLWHNGSNTVWYAEVLVGRTGAVSAAACNSGDLARVRGPVGEALRGAAAAVRAS
ncbi:serine hydrolase [Brevundimonas sp. 2R-24]|uniref:Serine hydrolase n=1 Tax=Peiella sedimenti TaxID=3061083 RepID=A0ABT8SHC4_9CAUL|nr:serine hydrolase [Caulobacteraceae bacterium XZ-24]